MKSVRLVAALVAVSALVVVAAGCGGSSRPPVAAKKKPAHHYALEAEWYIRGAFTGAPYPIKTVACRAVGAARVSCTIAVSGYAPYLVCSSASFVIRDGNLTGGSFPKPKRCASQGPPS